jgi:hypothetical protein
MPITSYLNGKRFDLETKRVLSVAFELVSTALQIGASDDDVKQAIADKVIEFAKAGERHPDVLCERVLEDSWWLAMTFLEPPLCQRRRNVVYAKMALIELAKEFRVLAEDLERRPRGQ